MSRSTAVIPASHPVELFADTVDSPIGPLEVVADARAVCALGFADIEERLHAPLARRFGRFSLRRRRDPLGVRCGSGPSGGPRLSLVPHVTGRGLTDRATTAGGC